MTQKQSAVQSSGGWTGKVLRRVHGSCELNEEPAMGRLMEWLFRKKNSKYKGPWWECYWTQVWLLVAQEVYTERHMLGKRKDALLRKPAILGTRRTHVPKNQLPITNQWAGAPRGQFQGCIDAGQRLHVEQHSQLWQWSWTWSCDGLIGIILIVLSTVNSSSSSSCFQFQGQFVPISLRPVLKTVAAYVVATSCSSCS